MPKFANIKIKNNNIQQVQSYKHWSTIITQKCDIKTEIRSRIEQARGMFICMKIFSQGLN